MEKMICPKCKGTSYTSSPDTYNTCPYCNIVFSKYGADRRKEERKQVEMDCTVSMATNTVPRTMPAKTFDMSEHGVGIKTNGEIPSQDTSLGIDIPKFSERWEGRSAWVNSDKNIMGVKLTSKGSKHNFH